MQLSRIHHVAFAHGAGSPIDAAARTVLGLECAHAEDGAGFVERMLPVGDGFLQLLETDGSDGVVGRFVDRRGPGLHHVAFAVDDLDAALVELRAGGVEILDPAPRSGGMRTRIAFLHPRTFGGLLVELVEEDVEQPPAHCPRPGVSEAIARWARGWM